MTIKRQGDVAIKLIDAIPEGFKKIDPKKCHCAAFGVCAKHGVLAHGEVSGHAHRVVKDVDFNFKNKDIEIYQNDAGEVIIKSLNALPTHIVQTNGIDTPVDMEKLNTTYAEQGLHAPIPDVVPAFKIGFVIFPQEFDWASGEIQRARD